MTSPVAPGDLLLGKYRVERVLGQGGMGVVVAARHLELGELFAIKFLLPEAVQHPQAVERFVREARASARLKGEHVAKVHDVGRLPDGLPYMVLEHLSGKDLKAVLRERGPLPVAEAITYTLQACEAIAEAHGLGIIHRDIKPANLFLTRRANGTPCVKVLDFGISRQIGPEGAEAHSLTRTGMLLGSPYYMSPEQMLRTKEADARSDIWSVGCVLYELLTGKVPFHAEAITELVGKVLQEEPRPPGSFRGDLPPAVEAAVMRCLVKPKEMRFQRIEELVAALQGPAQPAVQPFAPPAAAPPPPFLENDATVPLASSGALAAITGSGQIANTAPGWGTTAPPAAQPAPPKSRVGLVVGAAVGLGVLVGGGTFLALRPPSPAPLDAKNAPSATARSASAPEALVSAAPTPGSSAEPAASAEPTASAAAAASAAPAPDATAKPGVGRKPSPGPVATPPPAPPTAKPTATPTAALSATAKKRGTMY
jgi:serine/threonine-protein kinase